MDNTTRERVNGELQNLPLPLAKPERALECFISPTTVEINGEAVTIGVVQEQTESKQSSDVIAALEAVMADTTSWFTRTVIERLKALRQPGQEEAAADAAAARAAEVDLLSDREREVLGLICEGMSDVQMSDALGLSENTVRNHIAALYRKIGVNRRTQAIIWARERGITNRSALRPHRRRPQPGKSLPY
jgi:DNA-binding CsgD family transcriptional regulator